MVGRLYLALGDIIMRILIIIAMLAIVGCDKTVEVKKQTISTSAVSTSTSTDGVPSASSFKAMTPKARAQYIKSGKIKE
jgi:hypothetical protein